MKMPIKTIVLSISMACLSSVAMAGGGHGPGGGTVISVDTNLANTLNAISEQGLNGVALNLAINTGDVDASVNTVGEGFDLSTGHHHGFQIDAQSVNSLTGDIKTTAIGAVNNGTINLQQGNMTSGSGSEFAGSFSGYIKGSVSSSSTDTSSGADQSAAAQQVAEAQQAAEAAYSEHEGWHHSSMYSDAASNSSSASNSASNSSASNYYTNATEAFSAAAEAGANVAISGSDYEYYTSTLSNYAAANVAFNSGDINASVNTTGFTNTLGDITTTAIGAANTGSITVTVK